MISTLFAWFTCCLLGIIIIWLVFEINFLKRENSILRDELLRDLKHQEYLNIIGLEPTRRERD